MGMVNQAHFSLLTMGAPRQENSVALGPAQGQALTTV